MGRQSEIGKKEAVCPTKKCLLLIQLYWPKLIFLLFEFDVLSLRDINLLSSLKIRCVFRGTRLSLMIMSKETCALIVIIEIDNYFNFYSLLITNSNVHNYEKYTCSFVLCSIK